MSKHKAKIFTEGKTDLLHLRKAYNKLGIKLDIEFDDSKEPRGDMKLLEHCESLADLKSNQLNPLIFIFDADNSEIIKKANNNKQMYKDWGNNIYSFSIPQPKNRQNKQTFSIEFYYTDDEIKTADENGKRLYLSSEFNETSGKHLEYPNIHYANKHHLKGKTKLANCVIIDSEVYNQDDKNIALSKNDFAENVSKEIGNFKNFDFSEFSNIFEVMRKIMDAIVEKSKVPITRIIYKDRPPIVPVFMGREEILEKFQTPNIRAISISGIGGEGKSTIAAKYFSLASNMKTKVSFEKYGWFDCKELDNTFHDKLLTLLEYLTDGVQTKEMYSDENAEDTIFRFIDFLKTTESLIVFDNIDAFVNKDTNELIGELDILIKNALNQLEKSLIILTSRPTVITNNYFSFLPISLEGLKKENTIDLCKSYGLNLSNKDLENIYHSTNGHALMLNLIFANIRNGRLKIENLDKISDFTNNPVLNSIWNNLKKNEQEILWVISTFNRPPDIKKIAEVANKNYAKIKNLLKSLVNLSLIIEINIYDEIHYDLHPIIKMKSIVECPNKKREEYRKKVLLILSEGDIKNIHTLAQKSEKYTLEFDRYIECAEIALRDALVEEAIDYIEALKAPLMIYGEDSKYIQLCKDLMLILDEEKYFIGVNTKLTSIYESFIDAMLNQGNYNQVDILLKKFKNQVKAMEQLKCYSFLMGYNLWFQNKFSESLKFLESSIKEIESKNDVITSDLENQLGLTKRDSGRVEEAIQIFLEDVDSETLDTWDPENSEKEYSSLTGNLGRCYYLIGNYGKSLNYIERSVKFLVKGSTRMEKVNYGYGLLWLGDVYVKLNNFDEAVNCINKAFEVWTKYCPSRIKKIKEHISSYPKSVIEKIRFL